MKRLRVAVGALTLSAAGLVGIAVHEGYRPVAYRPLPRDVPTIGFGTTEGVRMGDSIDPVRALVRNGSTVSSGAGDAITLRATDHARRHRDGVGLLRPTRACAARDRRRPQHDRHRPGRALHRSPSRR